jgi:hypothetical protein
VVRGIPKVRPVTVSLVLRIASAALVEGRLAGRVRVVETGEEAIVRSADELVAFLQARAVAVIELDPIAPGAGAHEHGEGNDGPV